MTTKDPANDNDIFHGKSPFKGFRKEAVDDVPKNVVEMWWWLNPDHFLPYEQPPQR